MLWTDSLQASLMIICLLSIYIAGIQDAGGISTMYQTAKKGQRFDNIFEYATVVFSLKVKFWS